MSQMFRIVTSCDVKDCMGLSTQEWPAYVGHRVPEISNRLIMLPEGWTQLENGATACPRHKVQILTVIDGKHV